MLSSSASRCLRRASRLYSTSSAPKSTNRRAVTTVFGLTAAGVATYLFYPDPTRSAPTLKNAPLSPRYFTPAIVVSNKETGPDTKVLTLSVPPEVLAASDPNGFHTIWSVFIKDDDIQVERPYTPLFGIDDKGHMEFWIKKYPRGEVGRWLHTKAPGDVIEFRGPLATWDWKNDTWDEVVLVCGHLSLDEQILMIFQISGGTGFAPFHQLLTTVISNPTMSPSTRFTLLHSSRRPEELPPTYLLKPLTDYAEKEPDRLKVELFVDNCDEAPTSQLNVKRIDRSAIESSLGMTKPKTSWWSGLWPSNESHVTPKRRMYLICGPEP